MMIGRYRVSPLLWFVVGSLFLIGYGPARYYFLGTDEQPWLAPFSEDSARSIHKYDACRRKITEKSFNPETYKRVAFFTPKFVRLPEKKKFEPRLYSARWEFTLVDEQQIERTFIAVRTFKKNGQFVDVKVQNAPKK